jgi:hypothetical protein
MDDMPQHWTHIYGALTWLYACKQAGLLPEAISEAQSSSASLRTILQQPATRCIDYKEAIKIVNNLLGRIKDLSGHKFRSITAYFGITFAVDAPQVFRGHTSRLALEGMLTNLINAINWLHDEVCPNGNTEKPPLLEVLVMFLGLCLNNHTLTEPQCAALQSHFTPELTLDLFKERFRSFPELTQRNPDSSHSQISTNALRLAGPPPGPGVCYNFTKGLCDRPNCRFSHSNQNHDERKVSEANICKFFLRGDCKKGRDCNFVHDSRLRPNKEDKGQPRGRRRRSPSRSLSESPRKRRRSRTPSPDRRHRDPNKSQRRTQHRKPSRSTSRERDRDRRETTKRALSDSVPQADTSFKPLNL